MIINFICSHKQQATWLYYIINTIDNVAHHNNVSVVIACSDKFPLLYYEMLSEVVGCEDHLFIPAFVLFPMKPLSNGQH